jgi:competence protein ComEA
MKQLLIFFVLLVLAASIDLKPVLLKHAQTDAIHITVKGALDNPGSFSLPPYSQIEDLLKQLQLAEDADIDSLNPSTFLKDGDYLYVPVKKAETQLSVSINTASVEELCLVPGIGPAMAERIVSCRKEKGLFQSLEDLMNVKGIGPAKFEKMKAYIHL